ncbi:ATP synthase A1 subunit C [Nanoarchaeota archaeon]
MKQTLKSLEQQENGGITLGFYPYTLVRVIVMRSKLLKKEEYHKLMKMKFGEIAKHLQDSEYKKEINEFGVRYSGANLLEVALTRNLARTFQKLRRIAEGNLQLVVDAYMHRNDIWNIKNILRGKFVGMSEQEIEDTLIPSGNIKEEILSAIVRKDSIEDVISLIPILSKEETKSSLESYKQNKDLIGVENILEMNYINFTLRFANRLTKQGKLFKELLEQEVNIKNLITVLRLKRENLDKKDIEKSMLVSKELKQSKEYQKLAELPSFEKALEYLKKHPEYKKVVQRGIESYQKDGSLIALEADLNKYILRKALLLQHQHPLSADIILGFMLAKEQEVRNLKAIIKGKQLGLEDEFIESNLII